MGGNCDEPRNREENSDFHGRAPWNVGDGSIIAPILA
jgi:hypothetical protein